MKVITQLVKHFWQRGALSAAEVEHLVGHGFIRTKDLTGYEPPVEEDEPTVRCEIPVSLPTELERVEEAIALRGARGGKSEPKLCAIEAEELCHRVRREMARRSAGLEKLVQLVGDAKSNHDWQSAMQHLRQSPGTMHEALVRSLAAGTISLANGWQALDVEPFHRLVAADEMRGRAARAYLALLATGQGGSLGKYTWILQHDDMQTLLNLRIAAGYFLAALGRMYRHSFRVLTKAVARTNEPVLVWSLVLLHNAHRAGLDARDSRSIADYGPVPLPSPEVLQQAWTAALGMDRAVMSRLLGVCYGDGATPAADHEQAPQLYCPVGWHVVV